MSRPHVFLITADGLRYDRLSHSGNDVETTPTLDKLANSGAVCHNTIATGTGTRTSFPGILTSSYPLMYGGFSQMTRHRLPISELFQERGYVTLGVNTNAQLHTRFGWDRGYDVYYDSEQTTVNNPVGAFTQPDDDTDDEQSFIDANLEELKSEVYERLDHDGALFRTLETAYRQIEGRTPPYDRAVETVDRTLSFIDQAPDDEPLFVWIHFMETHSPYFPPGDYRTKYLSERVSDGRIWRLNDRLHTEPDSLTEAEVSIISQLYNGSLRYLDDQIGRLFDGLRERDLWDDSAVAFSADHGEQFREHGELTHCAKPYEEGVHVPLLFRIPDEHLTDIDGVTSTIDIAPTLLDIAFDDPRPSEKYHGQSLVPVLGGEAEIDGDRAVFSQDASEAGRETNLAHRITGCRTADWKYITSVQDDFETLLFALQSDPGEQENVVADHPDVRDAFADRVERHYQQSAYTDYEIADAVDTGHVSERLQALGYLDE
ncbi:sulfatase [Haloarcula salinisoli]|uniref:Sulfatase-like hydrolase/transferase n=1 Tax=Haloarcula salinisoli TaxID=2487746 RepID=A0A8J7YBT7_9EURY|nr:sulfatase [Halomicroarcula salinisoli]MBX0303035.1 sulfatase-like hydrolase/transferase [Halomicroarcula salinisoli]